MAELESSFIQLSRAKQEACYQQVATHPDQALRTRVLTKLSSIMKANSSGSLNRTTQLETIDGDCTKLTSETIDLPKLSPRFQNCSYIGVLIEENQYVTPAKDIIKGIQKTAAQLHSAEAVSGTK